MESNEKRLKEIETEMLRSFAQACDKLGIRYYIIYGTLLGAVRHKGFIPWDDDIDVGLMRKDYEVFIKNAQSVLPDYYFVQTYITDPEYLHYYAKIRDSRTTFIETEVKNYHINHGIYIDVFPLDYYPEKKVTAKWLWFKEKVIHFRKRLEYSRYEKATGSWIKEKIANAIGIMTKVIYPTVESAQQAHENMYMKQKESPFIFTSGVIANSKLREIVRGKLKEIVRAEWYGEGVELEFEGLKVRGPTDYDNCLRNVYGDYMQLPPEDKRVTNHNTEVIDTEKPYTEYIK